MFHPRPHIRPRTRYLIAPLVLWGLFSAGPLRAQSEPAPPLRDTLAASAADTTLVVAPDSVAARPTGWERFKRF